MKTILVTWWTGFIGSHTVVALHEAGYTVVSIDNFANSTPEVNRKIEQITGKQPIFYEGSIQDTALLDTIFTAHHIDAVIHFAAYKAVGESCEYPFMYYANNIWGTLALLERMQRHDMKRIVFSSSTTVYAANDLIPPFAEGDQTGKTTNPYGTTKFVAEYLLRDLWTHAWYDALALRYFNPVGAHPSGLLGEDPKGTPTNLLPYLLRVAQWRYPLLKVYGNDYDTKDGSCIRDYIHVQDVAEGHVMALEYMFWHEGMGFDAVNLWTGQWTSVLECLSAAETVLQRAIPYEIAPRRAGDIAVSIASAEKAKKLFAWEAKLTIEDAIRDARHFMQTTHP